MQSLFPSSLKFEILCCQSFFQVKPSILDPPKLDSNHPVSFYISIVVIVLKVFFNIAYLLHDDCHRDFSRWCHGSPVHRYGLYALQWIVEVNGKLTPDLDTFVNVTKVRNIV